MSPQNFPELREGIRQVVSAFDSRYWQEVDEARAFPEKFVTALTEAGWLSALIPEEYGGSNLSLTEASVIMEEINRAGGNSGACHGQMYVMGCVVRHGSKAQKDALLPKIASGELRTAYRFEVEAYKHLVDTDDRREGVTAFNEKRPPVFKGH